MTGFGSLYYTDCVPGQGLQGGAGFQFQAATPGAATEAMHIVQRSALYEPPAAWMRDRRRPEEYPRSLAHTAEEGFLATAAGRYLGQEANGTRQGNQFTHAVVTRDPSAYGSVRPAQLWGADWWADRAADGTILEELPPEPGPGPLDVETVRDRVRAIGAGEALLRTLVSALELLGRPATRRTVVLVSADPERAACWLAAATLLLPCTQALRISFKIFVTDPQYGRHDVIAVHPEWAGRWADTRDDSGLVVLDLDRERCSDVHPTLAAAFWVPRFLRDDPYDVVDAVELAGQFAAARSREQDPRADASAAEPTEADRLVAVVDRTREPLRRLGDVEAVAQWLQTAPEEAIKMARDTALEAVLATVPRARVLRTMARAANERGWDDAAVHRVLDGLLASELVEAQAGEGRAALRAVLGHLPLDAPRRAATNRSAARASVESALAASPPDHVPALLAVARRHGIAPATGAFADVAYRFARWWLEQDDDELMPQRWKAPDEALDWVRDVLHQQLAAGGRAMEGAVVVVRDRWWEPLRATPSDPRDTLDVVVWAALYRRLPWDGQDARALRDQLMDTCTLLWPGPDGATATWNILYRFTEPTLPECCTVVRELGQRRIPMSLDVASAVVRLVDAAPELTAEGLALVHVVDEAGYARLLSRALVEHRDRDRTVGEIVDDLRAQQPRWSDDHLVAAVDGTPAELMRVRMPALVQALLAAPFDRAVVVLRSLEPETFRRFGDALQDRWPRARRPATEEEGRAAALTFVVTDRATTKKQEADFSVLRNLLEGRVGALGKEERAAVYRALPSADWRDAWMRWLRDADPTLLQRLGKVRMPFRGDPSKRKG